LGNRMIEIDTNPVETRMPVGIANEEVTS